MPQVQAQAVTTPGIKRKYRNREEITARVRFLTEALRRRKVKRAS